MKEKTEFENHPGEKAEDWKNRIELNFFFAPHVTAEDFRGLEEKFGNADVYVPEVMGVNAEIKEIYNDISRGTMKPEEVGGFIKGSATEEILQFIYKTNKPLFFADIPEGHNLLKEYSQSREKAFEANACFLQGRFTEALKKQREFYEQEVKFEKKREDYMQKQIAERLPIFVEEHPQLKEKLMRGEKLKILLSLGTLHTPLYQQLKKDGFTAKGSFNQPLIVFPEGGEASRRIFYKKDVGDELIAVDILGNILSQHLYGLTDSTIKRDAVLRKITSRLSFDDIRKISERRGVLGKDIIEQLKTMGIDFPRTGKQFEEMANS